MKLIFLGSGSAFTVGCDNYQSNMILQSEGHNLLIDCGTDARLSLYDARINYSEIEAVFISHLHSDHIGGLEWLAFCTFFDPKVKKPKLFISKHLVEDLWNHVLAGGLSTLENEAACLSTYFDVVPIEDNGFFTWYGVKLELIQTYHVISDHKLCPSYGLLLINQNCRTFLTADTKINLEAYEALYRTSDIIFHDCETSDIPSTVHAHFNELKHLDPSIKQKMWLYHHNPGPLPDAQQAGFKGFVQKGQIFDL